LTTAIPNDDWDVYRRLDRSPFDGGFVFARSGRPRIQGAILHTLTYERRCAKATSTPVEFDNWHTGEPDAISAVGGAMDLADGLSFEELQRLNSAPRSSTTARDCALPISQLK